jgi:hypothetical protein
MTKKLSPSEDELRGKWVRGRDGCVAADEVEARINWLVSHHLRRICSDESGWDVLYQDPQDGRLWELTYPDGEYHGGDCAYFSVVSPARLS